MEYNRNKSVTIPNQVMPLRELLHRFTNGVPISDNLERQGTYDFSSPFDPSKMPTDEAFMVGHDVNEIDITIVEAKARRGLNTYQDVKQSAELTGSSQTNPNAQQTNHSSLDTSNVSDNN